MVYLFLRNHHIHILHKFHYPMHKVHYHCKVPMYEIHLLILLLLFYDLKQLLTMDFQYLHYDHVHIVPYYKRHHHHPKYKLYLQNLKQLNENHHNLSIQYFSQIVHSLLVVHCSKIPISHLLSYIMYLPMHILNHLPSSIRYDNHHKQLI